MNNFRAALNSGDGLHPSGPAMPAKKPAGADESKGLGSVTVPRETVRSANHRDDDRHRLQAEHARLRVGRKIHDVDLINLSGGGAMIETGVKLAMWQKVHLGLGDCAPVECAVRWIRGNRIGLEFAHETQVGGDSAKRAQMLLNVLQRSFPDIEADATAAKNPEPAPPAAKVAKDASGTQRRTELRHPLIWWGEIHYNHDSTRVRLRNISEQGALVDSDIAFPANAEVLLDLGGAGQHFATVSWSRGDQAGLRFTAPFDIAALSLAKPEVATHQWTRPSYIKSGRPGADSGNGWECASLPQLRDDLEGFLKR